MRVHGQKVGVVESAVVAAGGEVLVGKTKLPHQPQHLLDIEGGAAAPDPQRHGPYASAVFLAAPRAQL